jgi:hypothetical protein
MLRDLVHEQGEPRDFLPGSVRLTEEQLGEALREYDDLLPEAALEILESVVLCLRDPNNSYAQLFRSPQEAIGYTLLAALRNRLTPLVRRDLACTADDMETEDAQASPLIPEHVQSEEVQP